MQLVPDAVTVPFHLSICLADLLHIIVHTIMMILNAFPFKIPHHVNVKSFPRLEITPYMFSVNIALVHHFVDTVIVG